MRGHEVFDIRQAQGIIVPVMTPFEESAGGVQVDVRSQDMQLRRLVDMGVSCIFLTSNAGEGRHMNPTDWKTSVSEGIASVHRSEKDRSTPVFVGVLREDIDEVVEFAKYAESAGADALVFAPKYTKGDMTENLARLVQETSLPIILYNNPEFQEKENIPLPFIQWASQLDQVIGIKDTSRDLAYFQDLLKLRDPDTFHVVQGDTKTPYLNEQLADIDGMVPVEANVYLNILMAAWEQGDTSRMQEMMDFFERHKKEYGGTLQMVKAMLHEVPTKIFSSPMMYPKQAG